MSNTGTVVPGRESSPEDLALLELEKTLKNNEIKILSEGGNILVALSSTLLAAYTGFLTLFDLGSKYSHFTGDILLLMTPIILWAFCIFLSAQVNIPKLYKYDKGCLSEIREIQNEIRNHKSKYLGFSTYLLIVNLIFSSIILLGLPSLLLATTPQVVELVVAKEQIPLIQNMSISIENGTTKTTPLTLIEAKEKSYIIKRQDNVKIEISKELIKGIVLLNQTKAIS